MTTVEPTPRAEKPALSMAAAVAAARAALEQGETRGALWQWDLASGRVEWDEGLHALFGYTELITDAAWRARRIHPKDRRRVDASLQRAAIVRHGAEWADRYRFRRADGSYATVDERAYVVSDDDGPRGVVGAIIPRQLVGNHTPAGTNGLAQAARARGLQ